MNFKELKIQANELVLRPRATLAEYRALARGLGELHEPMPEYVRTIRAAVLGSFTIEGLGDAMVARGLFHNLQVLPYEAGYNQFSQAILEQDGQLYAHEPDVVYLLVDTPDLLNAEHLRQFVQLLLTRTKADIIIADFIAGKEGTEAKAALLRSALKDLAKESSRVHVFDLGAFVARLDIAPVWYTKFVALGDLRIAPHAFPALTEALLGFAVSRAGNTRKCLVTDLDGTLWSGVVGEVGYENVVPNHALLEHLLALEGSGTILAILSKNNEADALEVFERRSDMHLLKDHFASWRINWQSKDANLRSLAEELSISTDSMVFIDDEPFQQHAVLNAHPEVAVLAPSGLFAFSGFSRSVVTEEDLRRSAMYTEERKRKESKGQFLDEAAFLQSLNLQVTIAAMTEANIERVQQLTQKTNQYNMTTRRLTTPEVAAWQREKGEILIFSVTDAFGDYGIVGACFIEDRGSEWHLDNFLMSCRVIGRGVERAVISYILKAAQERGKTWVTASFVQSKKNGIAAACYPDNGFTQVSGDSVASEWSLETDQAYAPPSYVTVLSN